jgi:L-lactate dehydrogenase complex protein LldF
VYPGPIGAILSPQLDPAGGHGSLPYASTLCGACYEVCPVKIDIPRILLHLRARGTKPVRERATMRLLASVLRRPRLFRAAQRVARVGERPARSVDPLATWLEARDLPRLPQQTFRAWWRSRGRT